MDRRARMASVTPSQGQAGGSGLNGSGLAGMGVEFVVAILVCLYAGRWLDRRVGTSPLFLIVGVFLGATVATISMYRRVFPPDKPGPPKSERK